MQNNLKINKSTNKTLASFAKGVCDYTSLKAISSPPVGGELLKWHRPTVRESFPVSLSGVSLRNNEQGLRPGDKTLG